MGLIDTHAPNFSMHFIESKSFDVHTHKAKNLSMNERINYDGSQSDKVDVRGMNGLQNHFLYASVHNHS
jgi:hypothetical protein